MKNRTKNKLFYVSLLVTILILFSMTFAIQKSIHIMEKSVDFLGYQIEDDERDKIGDNLVRYATAVESDIRQNSISAAIPTDIFRKYLTIFDDSKNIKDIYVINAGFSFEDGTSIEKTVSIICNKLKISSSEDKSQIESILQKLMVDLKDAEKSNGQNINGLLDSAISKISLITHQNQQEVQNILFSELFTNNKIILATSKVNQAQFNDKELDKLLSNDSWNEWIAIPKGYLGVNNESYVDKGKPNLNYNKYIVIVQLDKDRIMNSYYQLKDKTDNTVKILLAILVVTTVLALSLCAVRFARLIDRGGDIEPIIKSNTTSDDDAFDKLLHWIHSKSK